MLELDNEQLIVQCCWGRTQRIKTLLRVKFKTVRKQSYWMKLKLLILYYKTAV